MSSVNWQTQNVNDATAFNLNTKHPLSLGFYQKWSSLNASLVSVSINMPIFFPKCAEPGGNFTAQIILKRISQRLLLI